jgi:gliding motility-associated-like protein
MKNSTNNNISDINQHKVERPFTTPDGFFDDLEKQILDKTIHSPEKASIVQRGNRFSTQILLRYAAIITLVLATAITIILLSRGDNPAVDPLISENDTIPAIQNPIPPVHQEPAINNNSQPHKQSPQEEHQEQNSIIQGSDDSKVINKNQKSGNQPLPNYTPKNKDTQNQHYANQELKNQNQSDPSNNNSFQIGNQYIIDNPNNNNTPVISRVRISNPDASNILQLCKDTCAISSIKLFACQDESKLETYRFEWSTGDKSPSVTIYESGVYYVIATNKQTREVVDSACFKVAIIPQPEPNLGPDQTLCSHESITLDAGTQHKDYTYSWSGIGNANTSQAFVKRLSPGDHSIKVEVSACGTTVSDEIIVHVNECILQFSNVITPNGDGMNDNFVIKGLEAYPGSQLYIIDRNGKVVYESLNYLNNWSAEGLAAGTYFYLLKVNDPDHTEKGGSITVIRK